MNTEIQFFSDYVNLENLRFYVTTTENFSLSLSDAISRLIASRQTIEERNILSNFIFAFVTGCQNSSKTSKFSYNEEYKQTVTLFDKFGNRYFLKVVIKK